MQLALLAKASGHTDAYGNTTRCICHDDMNSDGFMLSCDTCVAQGTVVGVMTGRGVPIEQVVEEGRTVLGVTRGRVGEGLGVGRGVVERGAVGKNAKGERRVHRVWLANGHHLDLTDDHRVFIRTADASSPPVCRPARELRCAWRHALNGGQRGEGDEVMMGMDSAVDDMRLDTEEEQRWSLPLLPHLPPLSFSPLPIPHHTPPLLHRDRALAFARILGFTIGRGRVRCSRGGRTEGVHDREVSVRMDHALNVEEWQADVRAVVGADVVVPRPQWRRSRLRHQLTSAGYWRLPLPSALSSALRALPGCADGQPTSASSASSSCCCCCFLSLPTILSSSSPSLPPSAFLREYLAALYGAVGSTLRLQRKKGDREGGLSRSIRLHPSRSHASCPSHSSTSFLHHVRHLLSSSTSIPTRLSQKPNHSSSSSSSSFSPSPSHSSSSSHSSLVLSDLLSFSHSLSYRYDVVKQLRLSVACAYLRYTDNIRHQRSSPSSSTPPSADTRTAMPTLHDSSSPTHPLQLASFPHFLSAIGLPSLFSSPSLPSLSSVPVYYLPLISLTPLPSPIPVYDLSILPPHPPSFIAAGIAVHNCDVWQHGDCLSVNERSVPEQYFCFDWSTELLLADGHSKAARDIQVNDMVLDERGQPTPVTGVQRAYQLVLPPDGEEGPAHLVNAGIPALPAVDMYEFGFVDYNLNAGGTATHPPLIVTGDHRMELISNRSVTIVRNARTPRLGIVYMAVWTAASGLPARGAGSDIPNEQQPPDAYLHGPHPLQSWPYEKTRTVNVQRTQANPAGATVQELEEDKARARREAWQAHNIRSPFFWRPTARDYDRYLWWCFDMYRNGNQVHPATGAPLVRDNYYLWACTWATYQPSALSSYNGVIQHHGQPPPVLPPNPVAPVTGAQPVLGLPAIDQRVTPLHFRPLNFNAAMSRFEHLLRTAVFTPANFPTMPAGRPMNLDWTPRAAGAAVEPRGLVLRLAWLVGFWLGDGRSDHPMLLQSDRGRPPTRGPARPGGDHTPAIDEVLDIARHVHAAIGSPAVQQAHLGQQLRLPGPWLAGPLPPVNTRPSVRTDHTNAVQRETFDAAGLSFQPRSWRLYPALHGGAGNWFSLLLTSLRVLAPQQGQTLKHFPMLMLSDSIDVRRYLLAGFIDADGSPASKASHSYQIGTEQHRPIADGCMHLARGLGYTVGGRIDDPKRVLASPSQVQARDPRIDQFGYISFPGWKWHIGGVPADSRQGGTDPTYVPVTMVYKQVQLLPPATRGGRGGVNPADWITPNTFTWSCVPTRFSTDVDTAGNRNIVPPLSVQVAGGMRPGPMLVPQIPAMPAVPAQRARRGQPAIPAQPAVAFQAAVYGPRVPIPQSSAYVSIQVGGSNLLLTAETLVVHNCELCMPDHPIHVRNESVKKSAINRKLKGKNKGGASAAVAAGGKAAVLGSPGLDGKKVEGVGGSKKKAVAGGAAAVEKKEVKAGAGKEGVGKDGKAVLVGDAALKKKKVRREDDSSPPFGATPSERRDARDQPLPKRAKTEDRPSTTPVTARDAPSPSSSSTPSSSAVADPAVSSTGSSAVDEGESGGGDSREQKKLKRLLEIIKKSEDQSKKATKKKTDGGPDTAVEGKDRGGDDTNTHIGVGLIDRAMPAGEEDGVAMDTTSGPSSPNVSTARSVRAKLRAEREEQELPPIAGGMGQAGSGGGAAPLMAAKGGDGGRKKRKGAMAGGGSDDESSDVVDFAYRRRAWQQSRARHAQLGPFYLGRKEFLLREWKRGKEREETGWDGAVKEEEVALVKRVIDNWREEQREKEEQKEAGQAGGRPRIMRPQTNTAGIPTCTRAEIIGPPPPALTASPPTLAPASSSADVNGERKRKREDDADAAAASPSPSRNGSHATASAAAGSASPAAAPSRPSIPKVSRSMVNGVASKASSGTARLVAGGSGGHSRVGSGAVGTPH